MKYSSIKNSCTTNTPQIYEMYWYESKNKAMRKMYGILLKQLRVNLILQEGCENQTQKMIQIHRATEKEDKPSVIS